jgi:hypothetical protein
VDACVMPMQRHWGKCTLTLALGASKAKTNEMLDPATSVIENPLERYVR